MIIESVLNIALLDYRFDVLSFLNSASIAHSYLFLFLRPPYSFLTLAFIPLLRVRNSDVSVMFPKELKSLSE